MSRIVGDMKLTKPVKGQNLYLTINRKLQLTAQQAILDQIATARLITQPAGEILQAVQLMGSNTGAVYFLRTKNPRSYYQGAFTVYKKICPY